MKDYCDICYRDVPNGTAICDECQSYKNRRAAFTYEDRLAEEQAIADHVALHNGESRS